MINKSFHICSRSFSGMCCAYEYIYTHAHTHTHTHTHTQMDMTNDFIEDLKSSKDPNFKLAGKNLDIFINEKVNEFTIVYF